MYLPVWAIVLLGLGWLGFLWLALRRDGGRDLAGPPSMAPRASAPGFAPQPLPGPDELPPDVVAEIRRLATEGRKIEAIKLLRERTACSLADGREWVERLPITLI